MKKLKAVGFIAAIAALAFFTPGCTTALGTGKVVSVTERGIGFKVAQAVANQTPEVTFGFFSSTVVLVPTSTNADLKTPNYGNTFDFNQGGALNLGIGESLATGNFQTAKANETNAITSQPIIPK
jgi:predicted small secreted protein